MNSLVLRRICQGCWSLETELLLDLRRTKILNPGVEDGASKEPLPLIGSIGNGFHHQKNKRIPAKPKEERDRLFCRSLSPEKRALCAKAWPNPESTSDREAQPTSEQPESQERCERDEDPGSEVTASLPIEKSSQL